MRRPGIDGESFEKKYIKKKTYQGYNMTSELNFPPKNSTSPYCDLIKQDNPAQRQCQFFFKFLDTSSNWICLEDIWLIKNVTKWQHHI